jgi:hypothetical protein
MSFGTRQKRIQVDIEGIMDSGSEAGMVNWSGYGFFATLKNDRERKR